MSPIEIMSSSPGTCAGFSSKLTVENTHEELSLCDRASILSDGFTVADVASMTQKFGWWNVVDGAMLQRFSNNKPTNASERWFRLEKKAAKVGKGLVKNGKGRKLVSQHWLEAIDPLHRYGHNLRFYFEEWCRSDTNESFFYWLDFGEGKDLELEACSKSTLQNERIRYLGPGEREQYEVTVEGGKLVYKQTKEPVNTTKGDKWIFVMSTSGVLYVGKKERGSLQHSSFLAGAATTSAGRLRVRQGIIQLIEAHSGHYRPTEENFKQLVLVLESRGADMSEAKIQYSSKEMLKPSKSLKCIPVDLNRGEKNEESLRTPAPPLASQGSLSSLESGDATGELSWDDCTEKGNGLRNMRHFSFSGRHDIFKQEPQESGEHSGDECNEKENILKDLRQFSFSGRHDIFKQEHCRGKEEVVDGSDRTSATNLVSKDGSDHSSGSEGSSLANGRKWTADFAERNGMYKGSNSTVREVVSDGQEVEHPQDSRTQLHKTTEEPPSPQEEKVSQERIE